MKKTTNYNAAIFSQRYKNSVYEEVIKAVEKAAAECGTTRSGIADNLGYSKAHISRLLSGPSNWTLDTISNLLYAIDAEMVSKVMFFEDCPKQNHYHEMGEPVVVAKRTSTIKYHSPVTRSKTSSRIRSNRRPVEMAP